MRDLLGSGYVPDYYENAAADFTAIATACWREGYKRALADQEGKFGRSIWTYLGVRECEHVECGTGCLYRA